MLVERDTVEYVISSVQSVKLLVSQTNNPTQKVCYNATERNTEEQTTYSVRQSEKNEPSNRANVSYISQLSNVYSCLSQQFDPTRRSNVHIRKLNVHGREPLHGGIVAFSCAIRT